MKSGLHQDRVITDYVYVNVLYTSHCGCGL